MSYKIGKKNIVGYFEMFGSELIIPNTVFGIRCVVTRDRGRTVCA